MRCHGQLFHNHLFKEKFKLVKEKLDSKWITKLING
jgi:hypothetical protein